MPTVTLSRSDLFPIGTTVGIYPAAAQGADGSAPRAAAIATGVVDAAGALSVTDAGILSYTAYIAAASVGGSWNYARLRSTLDVTDTGKGIGTGDTAIGSAALANVSASSGSFQIGQRISGPAIPPGTFLISGSGASWVMSDKATANGTGVALEGHGAARWRARVMRRRSLAGTS